MLPSTLFTYHTPPPPPPNMTDSAIHMGFNLFMLPVSELREPKEGLCIIHLLGDELLNYISSMDINSTDGHDLLSITFGQVSKKMGDEGIELRDLNKRNSVYIQIQGSNSCYINGIYMYIYAWYAFILAWPIRNILASLCTCFL